MIIVEKSINYNSKQKAFKENKKESKVKTQNIRIEQKDQKRIIKIKTMNQIQ